MDPTDPVVECNSIFGTTAPKKTAKVFALDISGSMNDYIGKAGESYKTVIDLISEISSSIVECNQPGQFAGGVSFNHTASVLFPISDMDDINRKKFVAALKTMRATGNTNLWGAIELSVKILHSFSKGSGEGCPCSVDLLTDGIPNVNPPNLRGYEASLDDLCAELDGFMPIINTFGFGGSIDVPLLESIALKTGGHFSYISDPGMAATAFVNSAAMWGAQENPVKLDDLANKTRLELVQSIRSMRQHCKISNFQAAQECLRKIISVIESSLSASEAGAPSTFILNEYLKDLYGEIALAVSEPAIFAKWGNCYLTSLSRAHEIKNCANFKDKGLQVYQTSPKFPELQKRISSTFTSAMTRLAAEGEALAASRGASYVAAAAMQTALLSNMYNPHGGCIDGRCIVSMADGSFAHLEDVQIGDKIFGGVDGRTIVEIYEKVVTKPKHGTELVYFSNTNFRSGDLSSCHVVATAWHPVFSFERNQWQFPAKSSFPKILCPLGGIMDRGFENVVSIAVRGVELGAEHAHGFLVNNSIVCATLAHDVKGDPVLEHPFWGSSRVIESIKNMKKRAASLGILNPILGAGPFNWKFRGSECVGISEFFPSPPFAPARGVNRHFNPSNVSTSFEIDLDTFIAQDEDLPFRVPEIRRASPQSSSSFFNVDISVINESE